MSDLLTLTVTAPAAPVDIPRPEEGSSSAIAEVLNVGDLQAMGQSLLTWIESDFLTLNMALQAGVIIAAIVPALIFGPRLRSLINEHLRPRLPAGILRRACDALATVATLIALWLILSLGSTLIGGMGQQNGLVDAAQSLLTAAIFIRLVTLVIRSPFWSRIAFFIAWPIAALDAFGILGTVVEQLDAAAIPIGNSSSGQPISLSALDILRAGIIFGIFFWIASLASGLINRQIQNTDELNPSFKALISKVLNFAMPVLALVLALNMIGFNLASLAVFSGAVGLGIGLGLQKIISNFLAGFTLLADKSIKPGDVIEVNGTFGWVTDMKSRYVSVRTRDGHENLIPNATFIDEGVINWSHSDSVIRIHAPFSISYRTKNLNEVQTMAVEAAKSIDRVVSSPSPVCNLMAFGDSGINFDLRFWISDPANGISNVRSAVFLKVWDALQANGIEIPYPQVDLHVKTVPETLDHGLSRKGGTD